MKTSSIWSRDQNMPLCALLIGLAILQFCGMACVAALLVIPVPDLSNANNLGVQGTPENVARAWIEAVVTGDCSKAESYVSPDSRNGNPLSKCNGISRIQDATIDTVIVTEHSTMVEVRLLGRFQSGIELDRYAIGVKEINGIWYIVSATS